MSLDWGEGVEWRVNIFKCLTSWSLFKQSSQPFNTGNPVDWSGLKPGNLLLNLSSKLFSNLYNTLDGSLIGSDSAPHIGRQDKDFQDSESIGPFNL